LEIEISCSQWEGSAGTQSAFFFSLSFGWGGEGIFFFFPLFLTCSLQVPIRFPRFPMCSPGVFPIAPCFNPICFAQSPPLLTYIAGPKGEVLHLSIESSILGSLHSFKFFLQWANCPKNKVGLVRHPQLMNMKQNK
jgi:hypothetical protein